MLPAIVTNWARGIYCTLMALGKSERPGVLDRYFTTKVDPDLIVVSHDIVPTYLRAPYGAILFGSLVIRGHLQATRLRNTKFNWLAPMPRQNEDFFDLNAACVKFDCWSNEFRLKVQSFKIYCLQICLFEEDQSEGPLASY